MRPSEGCGATCLDIGVVLLRWIQTHANAGSDKLFMQGAKRSAETAVQESTAFFAAADALHRDAQKEYIDVRARLVGAPAAKMQAELF